MDSDPKTNTKFSLSRDFFKVARILSLDVALGSLAGGLMVRRLFFPEMPWVFYLLLPLSVWVIYTLDHLLDARQLGGNSQTPRHYFHHVNFAPIVFVWGFVSAACGLLALLFLDQRGLTFGMVMIGFVLLHLFLVKLVGDRTSPFFIKEMGVAGIYCLGIWGLPLVFAFYAGTSLDGWLVAAFFFQYLLLSFVNLIEFSLYEMEIDKEHGHSSFVRGVGKKASRRLIRLAFVLFAAASIPVFFQSQIEVWLAEAVIVSMGFILLLIHERPRLFEKKERYRSWGDAVFLFPFFFELIAVFWLNGR